jgi:lipopolysaccharide transport system permease protein
VSSVLEQDSAGLVPQETIASTDDAPAGNVEFALTIIEPRPGWHFINFKELWRYRELLFFLAWRDVKVRYKQTVLGTAWAVLQPLATMVVFSLFFGRLAEMKSGGVPYPLFVFAGLLPWFFFSNAVSSASQSIVSSQNLVTKVYFPRLIIPMSAVAAGLVDFAITLGLLFLMMPYYHVAPGWGLLLVPFLALGLVVASMGVGALLSALTVAYRDFRHVVPFLIQLWMFATPSIYMYANTVGNPRWRLVLPLNPAYGLIANFRTAILGGEFDLFALFISGAVSFLLLIAGCLYFRRVEQGFADVI